MQNQIQEFNMKLVQDNKDITIIDYVKNLIMITLILTLVLLMILLI